MIPLANYQLLFSCTFIRCRYHQRFTDNMATKSSPKIAACKASENWTCVSFRPDLAKFGMAELEDDTVALMRKRVYDLAGVLGKGVKASLQEWQILEERL